MNKKISKQEEVFEQLEILQNKEILVGNSENFAQKEISSRIITSAYPEAESVEIPENKQNLIRFEFHLNFFDFC